MDKKERRKLFRQRRQRRLFLKFMSFHHDRETPYPLDHPFDPKELQSITPADIINFIEHRKPFHKSVQALEDVKSSIGFFMPDKDTRWDSKEQRGNPARSHELYVYFTNLKEEEKSLNWPKCEKKDPLECKKLSKEKRKRRQFVEFMSFFHGLHAPHDYRTDHEFNPEELQEVTPDDIIKFIDTKRPLHKAISKLGEIRTAIGSCMPDKETRWDSSTKIGNPAKSDELRDYFITLREDEGKKPKPLHIPRVNTAELKYQGLLKRVQDQNNDFLRMFDNLVGTIDQMRKVLEVNNAAIVDELERLQPDFIGPLRNTNARRSAKRCASENKINSKGKSENQDESEGQEESENQIESENEEGSEIPTTNHEWFHAHEDGRARRTPPSWTFPKCNLRTLYLLWHCGDDSQKICPMKYFNNDDINYIGKRSRVQLAEIRTIVSEVDKEATDAGLPPKETTMTIAEATACFEAGLEGIHIGVDDDDTGKVIDQLSWKKILKYRKMAASGHPISSKTVKRNAEGTENSSKRATKKRKRKTNDTVTNPPKKPCVSQIIKENDWWYLHDDGILRMVPPTWKFPKCNLHSIYLHWHCGDPEHKIYPMKLFMAKDVAHVGRGRMWLFEIKYLVTVIDEEAIRQGMGPKDKMTREEASVCYNSGVGAVKIGSRTPQYRNRDINKLGWASAYKYHRAAESKEKML